jgi:TolB-like protein/class 3 adenylate cyclase
MERRLAAILAADVVGYSRLMERDETDTFERLRALHNQLFQPEITEHHGRIFKFTGDGLLAEFMSVVDAVACAAALQRSMASQNEALPADQRIEFRMGVNLGDVIIEGDDIYGEGVNLAARLEQLADPGDIFVSQTVLEHVGNKLPFLFEGMGSHRVKNIEKPVAVHRLRHSDTGRRQVRIWPRVFARRFWIAWAAVLVLVISGAALGEYWWQRQSHAVVEKPTLAVLPFTSFGDDLKWDRLAEGLTEDVITDLSHSKDLMVIARNSTDIYKGKSVDVRQVGRDLGAKYVLEGSIRPSGDRARVTAQLIDAETGTHVWSERYDRPTAEIFNLQSELTEQIAATITSAEGVVAEAERAIVHRKAPENLAAFDYYLLGIEAKHSLTAEGLSRAEELFRKAVELDPRLARAYVGLVYTYNYMLFMGWAPSLQDTLAKQMDAAQKAVALDPNDGESHLALGQAYAYHGELSKAFDEFKRAEDLSPNNADLLLQIGWFIASMGQPARAVELAERSVRLNPHFPDWYSSALRDVYFFAKRFSTSLGYAKQVKDPAILDHAMIAMTEAYLGDTAAKSDAAEVIRGDPNWSAEQYNNDIGGMAEDAANVFAEGARKAGLPMCVSESKIKAHPEMLHLKLCDDQRASNASG